MNFYFNKQGYPTISYSYPIYSLNLILIILTIILFIIYFFIQHNLYLLNIYISILTGYIISCIFYYLTFWQPYKSKKIIFDTFLSRELHKVYINFFYLYFSLKEKENIICSDSFSSYPNYKSKALIEAKGVSGKTIFDFLETYNFKKSDLEKFDIFKKNHNIIKKNIIKYLKQNDVHFNPNTYFAFLYALSSENIFQIYDLPTKKFKTYYHKDFDNNELYKNIFFKTFLNKIPIVISKINN